MLGGGRGKGRGRIDRSLLYRVHVSPEDVPVLVRGVTPALPTPPLEVGRHHELVEVAPPLKDVVALATSRRHLRLLSHRAARDRRVRLCGVQARNMWLL